MRVGIVGCGHVVGDHAAAFAGLPGVDVVACCDVDPARGAGFAARQGIARAVGSVDALPATPTASTALSHGLGSRVTVSGPGGTAGLAEHPAGSEAVNHLWAVPGAESVESPSGPGCGPTSRCRRSTAPFHALQIADLVDALRTGHEPAATGREAARSLTVLTALYASAESGRPERVPSLEGSALKEMS